METITTNKKASLTELIKSGNQLGYFGMGITNQYVKFQIELLKKNRHNAFEISLFKKAVREGARKKDDAAFIDLILIKKRKPYKKRKKK